MCVICMPEIKIIDINDSDDFIILGCDGVFDNLTNLEVVNAVFNVNELTDDFHKNTGMALDNLMSETFLNRSTDNISAVLITFENFFKFFSEDYIQSTI